MQMKKKEEAHLQIDFIDIDHNNIAVIISRFDGLEISESHLDSEI